MENKEKYSCSNGGLSRIGLHKQILVERHNRLGGYMMTVGAVSKSKRIHPFVVSQCDLLLRNPNSKIN